MVEFGGWEMPVQYTSIIEEHRAVRTHAGLFDVSHMGEFELRGPRALDAVQRLVTNDVARLADGQALYTPMCLEDGGIIDDLLVYRFSADRYMVVVNAANIAKDFAWVSEHAAGADVGDRSMETALLALQGPRAQEVLQPLTPTDLASVAYYHFVPDADVAGHRITLSRTGYTGEDGFELYVAWGEADGFWHALMEAGLAAGLVPAGLGARDTLRLEAGFLLYGDDMTEQTTPIEARLGWTVKLDKGEFIGREILAHQAAEGTARRLVGFEMAERAIPRHGYAILDGGSAVGEVTSGTFGPWVEKNIGLGYVPTAMARPGQEFSVDVRGRAASARAVRLPFYKRDA